jgi:hypothetical protein
MINQLEHARLYQFGNFVIPSENGEITRDLGIKNMLDSSEYTHGSIRVNKFNQDFTEDTFYQIQFLNTKISQNQLDKIIYSKPQKIYFVEKYQTNNSAGDYRVYFAYASVYSSSKSNFACDDRPQNVEITLRQIGRRYLIEDNRLQFIKFDELLLANQQWEIANGTLWEVNDNTLWEDVYNGKAKNFNQLSYIDRLDLINCCNPIGFFDYKDLHCAQEVARIDTTAKNYIELNLTLTDAQNVYKDYLTRQGTNALTIKSTAQNSTLVFEIEKDGILPALGNGEWLEIISNQNQSGFKITCNNTYAPPTISVFTHKSNKLYNSVNNQSIKQLDPTNPQNFQKWKIERIGCSSSFFELSSNYSLYPYFENQDVEMLLIKRNFTGNLKIKIANLPTFY